MPAQPPSRCWPLASPAFPGELREVCEQGSCLQGQGPRGSGCWGPQLCALITLGGSHGCCFPKAVVIPGRGTCSESKFDHGKFQPRNQRFCGEAQAHWPHPHCAGDRSQTEMLSHPLWPHFSSSHSPRHPKICFRGANTRVYQHTDSGIRFNQTGLGT